MNPLHRRIFLKSAGLSLLPLLNPGIQSLADEKPQARPDEKIPLVKFWGDGEMFEPGEYLNVLQKANQNSQIVKDRYGLGGAVETLEKRFTEITGKEKSIFMPSGTMANQMAIATLSANNTKVFVQETSHVYRDEADAAQSVFQKRLMPLAKNETYFTAKQLEESIEKLKEEEVFQSGIGAVSIENPVRRADGKMVPIDEIKSISNYCRKNQIKLHLDGARIFMASAWSGISIKEYASYFDTIYISLYKYLGAGAGAILCGDKEIIGQMPHLMKIHGGSMYGNWANAAMALYRLENFESRLQESIQRSRVIFNALNKTNNFKIEPITGGTNIYRFILSKETNGKVLRENLNKSYHIRINPFDSKNESQLTVNETILYQPADYIIEAFKKSI